MNLFALLSIVLRSASRSVLQFAIAPLSLILLAAPATAELQPQSGTRSIAHNHGGGHDHSGHDHGEHEHGSVEVSADLPAPTLAISIEPDTMSGWNLEIVTENFEISGMNVGQANVDGQGHAHVYADGMKIARIYGNWYHIPGLPEGTMEIRVTLNSNQHEELMLNGEPIAATASVMP